MSAPSDKETRKMQIEETIRRLLSIRDEHRQAKLNKQTNNRAIEDNIRILQRQAKLNKQANKQAVSRLSDRHPAQGWCSQLLMIILFDDPMNRQ